MNRRDTFKALLALAILPVDINAQTPGRVYLVGVLTALPPVKASPEGIQALAKLGWVINQNLIFEVRYSEGNYERLPQLAAELVRLNVDVIVTAGAPETEAAKQATKTIPILFLVHGDPVGRGHVATLAKPGGNITGTSQMLPELCAKRVQLLRQLLPGASRVAVLWNAANPTKLLDWQATQDAARAIGLSVDSYAVRGPDDFDAAFGAMRKARPDGLMTLEDSLMAYKVPATVEFAASARMPAIYGGFPYIAKGGLMSYHISEREVGRLYLYYLDKILKGAKPADLPVQQPTLFSLAVNLQTAKALNLTIPQAILASADVVIS